MRRVLAATALVVAALAGCGGSAHLPNGADNTAGTDNVTDAPVATPTSQLDQCVQAMGPWEQANITALEQGYSDGENLSDIINEFGTQSPIFQAAAQLKGRIIIDASSHGIPNIPAYDFRQICTDAGAKP
jgi:hypothetical protein